MEFAGEKYGYVHNLQGDIVAIVDDSGTQVVKYTYDAWGKPLTKTGTLKDTLGTLNPFRYRGYVYDEETELYYLRSRYYNPVWGRFVNADTLLGSSDELLTHNIFAYCENKVVSFCDFSGNEKSSVHISSSGRVHGGGSRSFAEDAPFRFTTKSNTMFFYSEGVPRVQFDQRAFSLSPNLVPKNETATDFLSDTGTVLLTRKGIIKDFS